MRFLSYVGQCILLIINTHTAFTASNPWIALLGYMAMLAGVWSVMSILNFNRRKQ